MQGHQATPAARFLIEAEESSSLRIALSALLTCVDAIFWGAVPRLKLTRVVAAVACVRRSRRRFPRLQCTGPPALSELDCRRSVFLGSARVSLENPVFGETPRQPPAVTHMLPRAFAKRADDAACY